MKKSLTLSLVASSLIATNIYANSHKLEEITVTTATKSTQSIKNVTSNINVITKEEIEERRYTSVVEAINTIPGINILSNGGLGSSTTLRLRGSDNRRVLVLIDGMRFNDATSSSGASLSHLMISDIERIEVVKGAQSGIWGADASAGVVNIITKEAKKGFHANANLEAGSFNTKKYAAKISYKNDSYTASASVSKLESDSITVQAPRNIDIDKLEDDSYENTNANLKLDSKINDNNKISLQYNIIDAKKDYDGCENKLWKTAYGGYYGSNCTSEDKANAKSYKSESTTKLAAIDYKYNTTNYELQLRANKSDFQRDYSNDEIYSGGAKDGTSEKKTSEYDGYTNEYTLKNKYKYSNNSILIFGLDYKKFTHENEIDNTYNNKAVFFTNISKLNKNSLTFTQALRYDRYNKFDNKLTGKIGLKEQATKDLSVAVNYGTAYNVPSLFHLYSSYGREDINPETTKSFDFNVTYKKFAVTLFSNTIDNMIDYDSTISKYNNIDGKTRLKGFEIEYKKEIFNNSILSLNYTRLSAKDDNKEDLQRRAKENLKLAFDYYGLAKTHLNINANYTGDRVQYDYGTYNINARTGNYTVWNAVVNYNINKNAQIYLKANNIFDKYYQTIDGYSSEPRAAYVGLKAKF